MVISMILLLLIPIFLLVSCAMEEGKGNSYPEIESYSPKGKEIEVQFMSIASFSLMCRDKETPQERIIYRAYLNGVIKCDSEKGEGAYACQFYNFIENRGIIFQYQFSDTKYEHTVKLTCTDEPVGGYPARTVEKVWTVKVKGINVAP